MTGRPPEVAKGRDDGRLAGAHDHLPARRLAARGCTRELPHQLHLSLPQHEALHVLEDQEARVQLRTATGHRARVVAPGEEARGEQLRALA